MNRKTIILLFILALVGGIFLGLKLLLGAKITPLKVVFVSPENQATAVSISTQIKIDFNRPFKNTNEVVINFLPQIMLDTKLENDQKTLVLTPQGPLHSSTTYTLIIQNQKNHSFFQSIFTTQKLQGDPAIIYEEEKNIQEKFPLTEFIPYETKEFIITYAAPLTLKVTIKKGTKEEIAPIVYQWIKSHNIEPATHQIRWIIPGP